MYFQSTRRPTFSLHTKFNSGGRRLRPRLRYKNRYNGRSLTGGDGKITIGASVAGREKLLPVRHGENAAYCACVIAALQVSSSSYSETGDCIQLTRTEYHQRRRTHLLGWQAMLFRQAPRAV